MAVFDREGYVVWEMICCTCHRSRRLGGRLWRDSHLYATRGRGDSGWFSSSDVVSADICQVSPDCRILFGIYQVWVWRRVFLEDYSRVPRDGDDISGEYLLSVVKVLKDLFLRIVVLHFLTTFFWRSLSSWSWVVFLYSWCFRSMVLVILS